MFDVCFLGRQGRNVRYLFPWPPGPNRVFSALDLWVGGHFRGSMSRSLGALLQPPGRLRSLVAFPEEEQSFIWRHAFCVSTTVRARTRASGENCCWHLVEL